MKEIDLEAVSKEVERLCIEANYFIDENDKIMVQKTTPGLARTTKTTEFTNSLQFLRYSPFPAGVRSVRIAAEYQ